MNTAATRAARHRCILLGLSFVLLPLLIAGCDADLQTEGPKARALHGNLGVELPSEADANPLTCGTTGFSPEGQDLRETSPGVVAYRAVTSTPAMTHQADVLSIEMYQAGGFSGATAPGTYDLGEDYATCSNCVLIQRGCDQQGQCDTTFLATGGRLIIAEWTAGAAFRGYLEGVQLQQVAIDPTTFVATAIPNTDAWCLDYYAFDTLDGLLTGGHAHPGCVAQGTGTLIGDNIANLALPNCNGDMVGLHDTCGASKAVWLIGTTAACVDCDTAVRALSDVDDAMVTNAMVAHNHPGLTVAVVLGADIGGEAPTQAACYAYADRVGIDPAMVLIDHADSPTQVPLVEPAGYGFETQVHAGLWTALNPYLSAHDGVVTNPYPWMAVLNGRNMEYLWSTQVGPGTLNATLDALLQ